MRAKIFGICLVLMACLTLKSQTITSVTPNYAVTGQVLNVSIMGSNTNFSSASAIYLNGPSTIYASNIQIVSGTQVNCSFNISPNAPQGSYNLTYVSFTTNAMMSNAVTIGVGMPSGNYGQISGKVFKDTNLNCLYNTGEPVWGNRPLVVTPGNYVATSDAQGNYFMYLPLGNYSVTYTPPFPDTVSCPVGGTSSFTLSTPGQSVARNFGTTDFVYADAQIIVSSSPMRPGFGSNVYLYALNPTNDTIPTGLIKYKKPPFATFTSFSVSPTAIVGDTAIWTFTNLLSMQTIVCSLTTAVLTPIGTPYAHEAWIIPSPMDNVPQNNSSTSSGLVVGSYDPNDKHAFTGNGLSADGDISNTESLLRYVIRFQNTGSDTAFNIYVRDTLDLPNLEFSDFRMMGASHPYQLSMGSSGQMEVLFPNILLPDSGRNQVGSNGYFIFEVGIRSGLAPGTVIDNSASIYFDYNAPVKTNTVHTRLCDQLQSSINHSLSGFVGQFNALTSGTVNGLLWDFGDGSTSTQANPSHTYASDGNYTVCLVAFGACRNDTSCIQLNVCATTPTAAFVPTTTGFDVSFANNSQDAIAYHWDFGDGDTSALASPTHSYASTGSYTVCLIGTSSCGLRDTTCATVQVCLAPISAFGATSPASGTMAFTDSSTNASTWLWNFGDGSTATTPSTSHTWTTNGIYTICLTVSNACGLDSDCVSLPICPEAVTAGFSAAANQFTYQFTNQSAHAVSYAWDFGDGSPVSNLAAPTHTYAANGTYTVCLTATDLCGGAAVTCSTYTVLGNGIADPASALQIAVRPNPMHSHTEIWVNSAALSGEYELSLYTIAGAEVARLTGHLNRGLRIDRNGLAAGLYQFRISQGGAWIGGGRIVVQGE